jgi:hypothetical protein
MSRIFGEIFQNGYVVRDIQAAMRHWIEVLGMGPWFYIERLSCTDFQRLSGNFPASLFSFQATFWR